MAYIQAADIGSSSNLIKKEIDEGAYGLIVDNLQKYRYTYPIKSSIRELASNSIDAVREREIGLAILNGSLREEDCFVTDAYDQKNPLYKDSRFDPTYYDPNWLSDDRKIYITYTRREGELRDLISIEDFGVGLRPEDRLPGYLKIGYSSKRLGKRLIGKFGIGAKSPLSTGIKSYTIRNWYNGYEYALNVYSSDAESIMSDRIINADGELVRTEVYMLPTGVDENGITVHKPINRVPTTRKNGLLTEYEVKNTMYQKVVDAVKSQLMYYSQVEFKTITIRRDGTQTVEHHTTAASILLENGEFIVSDQNYYNQPHIVIGGMNYGLISFDELQIDSKQGALGIIIEQEDVDISDSREELVYSERTSETLLERITAVKSIANDLMQRELTFTNIAEWFPKARALASFSFSANSKIGKVMNALRYLVDQETLEPVINLPIGPYTIKEVLSVFNVRVIEKGDNFRDYSSSKVQTKITRTMLNRDIEWDKTYWLPSDAAASPKKDVYLIDEVHNSPFFMIDPVFEVREKAVLTDIDADEEYQQRQQIIYKYRAVSITAGEMLEKIWKDYHGLETRKRLNALCDYLYPELQQTALGGNYPDVVVPETVKIKEEDVTDDVEVAEKVRKQRVKMQDERKELLKTGDYINLYPVLVSAAIGNDGYTLPFNDSPNPVAVKYLQAIESTEIYYGDSADNDPLKFAASLVLHNVTEANREKVTQLIAAGIQGAPTNNIYAEANGVVLIRRNPNIGTNHSQRFEIYGPEHAPDTIIFRIPKKHMKSMKGFRHINDFFMRKEGKTITMAASLIRWNTARIVDDMIKRYDGIKEETLEQLPTLQAKLHSLRNYVEANYSTNPNWKEMRTELVQHMNRLAVVQRFAEDNPEDTETIAAMVKEVTGEQAEDVLSYHPLWVRLAEEVSAMLADVSMFRWIEVPDDSAKAAEMQADIANFISVKGLRDL